MPYRILVINPGSTSTKFGVYEDEQPIFDVTLRHSAEELNQFDTIPQQREFRKNLVLEALQQRNFDMSTLSAVAGRGGLVKPITGGTYAISDALVADGLAGINGHHAANLAAAISREIADPLGIPAYTVDPPVVDEMMPIARYAGHPLFYRKSKFHTLNQRAVAKRYAREIGRPYEDLNLIVCHLGGGISISPHVKGKVLDAGNGMDGDSPFSTDRSGNLPVGQVIDLCFSGKYTQQEIRKMVSGQGGLKAYTGSVDLRELTERAETDEKLAELLEAFYYRIAKEIGTMSVVFRGKVDQILLTGGIAYGQKAVESISKWVDWIAPITVYPGEDELLALVQGALRVLRGEETAQEY